MNIKKTFTTGLYAMLKTALSCACILVLPLSAMFNEQKPLKRTKIVVEKPLTTVNPQPSLTELCIPWVFATSIETKTIDCKLLIDSCNRESEEFYKQYYKLAFDEYEECIKIDFNGEKIRFRLGITTKTVATFYLPLRTLEPTKTYAFKPAQPHTHKKYHSRYDNGCALFPEETYSAYPLEKNNVLAVGLEKNNGALNLYHIDGLAHTSDSEPSTRIQKIKTVRYFTKQFDVNKTRLMCTQNKGKVIIMTDDHQLIICSAQPFAHLEKLHDVHYRFK